MTVRTARSGEAESLIDLFLHATAQSPDATHGRLLRGLVSADRVLAGTDEDGTPVATALSMITRLAIPGERAIPTGLVTAVGVLPTHRRRGYLTELMTTQLRSLRDEGLPTALLRSSEGPIYGRFGYGAAAPELEVTIPRRGGELAVAADPPGRFRLVGVDEVVPVITEAHDALWRTSPAEVERGREWWKLLAEVFAEQQKEQRVSFVVHEDRGGVIDGYAGYVIEATERGPDARIIGLYAADDEIRAALVSFCRRLDLVHDVKLRASPEDPLAWRLRDIRAFQVDRRSEGPWIRLLDVPAALEARAYLTDARLVIDVDDHLLKQNTGRWELTVDNGAATCEPTTAPADVSLDVSALASVYLGGVKVSTLARAGRARLATADAGALADRVLASDRPPLSQTGM